MSDRLDVCFVGLGSIGRRHLKNLHEIALSRGLDLHVVALRHEKRQLMEDIRGLIEAEYYSVEDLPKVDLVFICNPSQLHLTTLRMMKGKARCFFVEKPVFTEALLNIELDFLADEQRYYVACPLRHTILFRAMREFVSSNRIYACRAICSSYLPDWRPEVDYRKLYCAAAAGGGVKIDLIHDVDYLVSLFGRPQKLVCAEGRLSDLALDCPDCAAMLARYDNMFVELHLDYFGRFPQRYAEMYTENDTVRFDFINASATWYKSGKHIDFGEQRNDFQKREIEYFIDFASGEISNINSISFANDIISLLTKGDGHASISV